MIKTHSLRYVPTFTPMISRLALVSAFDGGKAGWKTEADGSLSKDADGNPIYIDTAGNEKVVGGTTIASLQGEARQHRLKAEQLAKDLEKFEGLDPVAARDAVSKLADIDLTKLVDSGKLEEAKTQVKSVMQVEIDKANKRGDELESTLNNTLIGYAFSQSKYIADNVAVPVDLLQAQFGKSFGVVNGKVVPVDADGKPLNSNKRAGEIADFDEGMEGVIKGYAHADRILKGDNQSGTGNQGNGGNPPNPGSKTIKRAAFDALPADKQAEIMTPVNGVVAVTVVD